MASKETSRKRMRLSSPTYDENVEDLDDDELKELDRIELTLSQLVASSSSQKRIQSSRELSQDARQKRLHTIMLALQAETIDGNGGTGSDEKVAAVGEKRTLDGAPSFKSAASLSRKPTSANVKYDHELSSSPEGTPPERDYTKWFAPDPGTPLIGFQRASTSLLTPAKTDDQEPSGFMSASKSLSTPCFVSASNMQKAVLEPSKSALELAAKKMKDWSEEDNELVQQATAAPLSPTKLGSTLPRQVLASVANTSSFRPLVSSKLNSPARSVSTPSLGFRTPVSERTKTFKSPLIGHPSPRTMYPKAGVGSISPNKDGAHVSRTTRPHPLASTPITSTLTPERPLRSLFSDSVLAMTTPVRADTSGMPGSAKRTFKPTFSTPFKQGMKPGEPGRATLEKAQQAQKAEAAKAQESQAKQDSVEQTKRSMLKASGLVPRRYTTDELEDMGINITELSQITLQTAPFYAFYTPASHVPSTVTQAASTSAGVSLGPAEAHAHLQQSGRTLASREWVDNHWALILWKLAGLACLDPPRELTPARRWCWHEVLTQLEARYDKEIDRGVRPPLRLIAAQDASAGKPLVLLVTAVLWSEKEQVDGRGKVIAEGGAELEVSDGWYRLRALLDAPLARAVVRGIIRAGRKIAVAGAKLDNNRKEPSEILEAYESCSLLLGGNGTHLAPWHAKLGFQAQPFIATLGSLTVDGGPVPLIDLVVEKVYPIAFLEFVASSPCGKKTSQGPRSEAEETEIDDQWRKRRDEEKSKVREELGVRWGRWEAFADRLERAAGGRFNPTENDVPPDHVEDLFDELDALATAEVGGFVRNLGPDECVWLARYLRRKSERDKELAAEEIELEVGHRCPPREVRNFCIVLARDAQTWRKPAHRLVQLTIWDVLALCVSEGGKPGAIDVGQRFLMTNLTPTQHSAWMGNEKDDMVYLASRRDTRFIRLK